MIIQQTLNLARISPCLCTFPPSMANQRVSYLKGASKSPFILFGGILLLSAVQVCHTCWIIITFIHCSFLSFLSCLVFVANLVFAAILRKVKVLQDHSLKNLCACNFKIWKRIISILKIQDLHHTFVQLKALKRLLRSKYNQAHRRNVIMQY